MLCDKVLYLLGFTVRKETISEDSLTDGFPFGSKEQQRIVPAAVAQNQRIFETVNFQIGEDNLQVLGLVTCNQEDRVKVLLRYSTIFLFFNQGIFFISSLATDTGERLKLIYEAVLAVFVALNILNLGTNRSGLFPENS